MKLFDTKKAAGPDSSPASPLLPLAPAKRSNAPFFLKLSLCCSVLCGLTGAVLLQANSMESNLFKKRFDDKGQPIPWMWGECKDNQIPADLQACIEKSMEILHTMMVSGYALFAVSAAVCIIAAAVKINEKCRNSASTTNQDGVHVVNEDERQAERSIQPN